MTEPTPLEKIVWYFSDHQRASAGTVWARTQFVSAQLDRVRAEAKREERERIRACSLYGERTRYPFRLTKKDGDVYIVPAEVLDAD